MSGSYSSYAWFNSKAVQCLVHKQMAKAGFNLSGNTNILGVEAWENETITRENRDKFDKVTNLLIANLIDSIGFNNSLFM